MNIGASLDTEPSDRERFLEALLASATGYAILATAPHGIVTAWSEGAHRVLG